MDTQGAVSRKALFLTSLVIPFLSMAEIQGVLPMLATVLSKNVPLLWKAQLQIDSTCNQYDCAAPLCTLQELRQYLSGLAEQCSVEGRQADTPVVVILDNLHHVSSLGEIFNGLLNCKYQRW